MPPHAAEFSIIIPALNEEQGLDRLLPQLKAFAPRQIIVGDNGSTDRTAAVAASHGAMVVYEPRRGYGAACQAALRALDPQIKAVVFIDADLSDDPCYLPQIVGPVLREEADIVIGTRIADMREPGAMTLPQRFGNGLAVRLIRWGWGYAFGDLGPFRAVGRETLERINMQDRAFGWTVEMQIRAVELGLQIRQIAVPYRVRRGRSKISGTIKGVFLAGYWIIKTIGALYFTRRQRAQTDGPVRVSVRRASLPEAAEHSEHY